MEWNYSLGFEMTEILLLKQFKSLKINTALFAPFASFEFDLFLILGFFALRRQLRGINQFK